MNEHTIKGKVTLADLPHWAQGLTVILSGDEVTYRVEHNGRFLAEAVATPHGVKPMVTVEREIADIERRIAYNEQEAASLRDTIARLRD